MTATQPPSGFQQIDLGLPGFEDLVDSLQNYSALGKAAAATQLIRSRVGRAFTFARSASSPHPLDKARIHNGGRLLDSWVAGSEHVAPWLADRLHTSPSAVVAAEAIVDTPEKHDLGPGWPSFDWFDLEGQLVWFASARQLADPEKAQYFLALADFGGFHANIVVLDGLLDGAWPRSGSKVPIANIAALMSCLSMVLVEAFDGCGYVIWDTLDTPTPTGADPG